MYFYLFDFICHRNEIANLKFWISFNHLLNNFSILLLLCTVGAHRVQVAHDLQADDEKVQKKVAKKLARQQVKAVDKQCHVHAECTECIPISVP